MAVNILETVRQMQRDLADQKEYTRNLHTINRDLNKKLNLMDERITDLPKLLVTVKRLERQVKNINMTLFGNDETQIETTIISEGTIMPYNKANAEFFGKKSENSFESTEVTELLNPSKTRLLEETELNCENEREKDEQLEKPKFTKKELGEIINKEMEAKNQPIRIPNSPFCKQKYAAEKPTGYLSADQTKKLEDKLDKITDLYKSDMSNLKQSINNVEETINTFTEAAASTVRQQETVQNTPTYFSTEQINQINAELKRITDSNQSQVEEVKKLINDNARNVSQEQIDKLISTCTELKSNAVTKQSEMRQMKELVKYFVAKKLPIEVSTASEQKTIQISPTYFSADQISKLNSELKRVAEIYQGTDMCPVIEVVPGAADEHPVMKQLRKGVYYRERNPPNELTVFKLGRFGLKRSDVIDKIAEFPDLDHLEVIAEWWMSRTDLKVTWNDIIQRYNFSAPLAYKDDKLVPIPKSLNFF